LREKIGIEKFFCIIDFHLKLFNNQVMTWIPKQLTRTQIEERRLVGGELLKKGRLSKLKSRTSWVSAVRQ
jgi:hypothetical protein